MPTLPFARPFQIPVDVLKRLTTIAPQEVKVTVGLDIGSSAVKVVALGPRKGSGPRPVIGQHLAPLSTGQDTDVSEVIKTAMSTLPLTARRVNLSVSGQWVIIRIVEMPTMKSGEMKQALPFEAQRYLPFNIQDVVIDGVVLGPADANKSWVLIVACKKELIERKADWVKRAGFEVALLDVVALALANAFLSVGDGRRLEGTRALTNVGAQLTNLVIFQGEAPYLVRDIPWGAEKLIRHSAEQMGADPHAVSEQLAKGQPSPDLLTAMKLASEALVTELQLSFDYFENRFGQPPEEVLVSGGLAQSAGFVDTLKSHFTQTVNAWVPVPGLSGQFSVAYGLALRTD